MSKNNANKSSSKKSNAATDTVENNDVAVVSAAEFSTATGTVQTDAVTPAVKKPRAKRKAGLMNYQAAQVTFLMDGFDTLKQNFADGKVTRPTIKRAAVEFKAKGRSGEAFDLLNAWVGDLSVSTGGGERGRKALGAGEERRYKAQSVKNSPTFLRAPLGAIGIKKGEDVVMSVSADGSTLMIRRAPAVEQAEPVTE